MPLSREIKITIVARDNMSKKFQQAYWKIWFMMPHWDCLYCGWRGRNTRHSDDGPLCPECGFNASPDINYPAKEI